MTIRRKLLTLVFGELLMILAAAAVVAFMIIPVMKINRETEELNKLSDTVHEMRLEMNLLYSSPMDIQQAKMQRAKEDLSKSFDVVGQQEMLKHLNKRVEQSMSAVLLLEELFEERWAILDKLLTEVSGHAEKHLFSSTVPLLKFYKTGMLKRADDYDEIMAQVGKLESMINITDGSLRSAADVIKTQFRLIQIEVDKKIRRMVINSIAAFAVIVILIVILAVLFSRSIVRNVIALEGGVAGLKDGNLYTRFNSSSRDEIGSLGRNLNEFSEELSSSILKIKEASGNSLVMKDELHVAAEDSTASTTRISDAVDGIRRGVGELDGQVSASGHEVATVKTKTGDLKIMLEEQMAMIEESTSAVTEMIASIGNVGEITGKKKAATAELVATAGLGGERLNETISVIQEITSNVDEIRGTASVIQSVAAQTSLLAMNAAIEAAHAGKYGAGFAVVAEEIRKLSEASGESSKRISGVLKDVVSSIEKAAVSGEDTRKAFININREVGGVSEALDEISGSMNELAAGGQQILEAMTSLRGYASRVQDGGSAMADASTGLENAFLSVERVTADVLSGIAGISNGVSEIVEAVTVVSRISGRLSVEAEKLDSEVERFNLEEAEPVAEEPASGGPSDEDSSGEGHNASAEEVLIAASVVD